MNFISFILLGWFAVIGFQKLKAKISNPVRRKFATFCGALLIIAYAEYVLPSSLLTGLDRPERQQPAQYLREVPFSDTPLTYETVAKSAPWLWSLGTLTHAEMKNRLKKDLKIVQDRLDNLDYVQNGRIQSISYAEIAKIRDATKLIVFIEGMQAALENLDTRFPDHLIAGADATRFIYRQMAKVLDARQQEFSAQKQAVDEKIAQLNNDRANIEWLDEDPEYQALKTQSYYLSEIIVGSSMYGFKQLKWQVARDGELQQPSAVFPDFKTPIQIIATKKTQNHDANNDIIIGPRNSKLDMPADLMDAITGRKRMRGNSILTANCAIGFRSVDGSPQLRKFCEFSVPLPLNYDLTATDCLMDDFVFGTVDALADPGTQMSKWLCKETWIQPHANIVLTDDSMIIYPPKPVFTASQPPFPAPMSRWSVKLAGKDYDLERPLALERNTNLAEQLKMSFTHMPREGVRNPRIWKDLRKPFPWTVLGQEISRASKRQEFSSTTVEAKIDLRDVEDIWEFGEIHSKYARLNGAISIRKEALSGLAYDRLYSSSKDKVSASERDACELEFNPGPVGFNEPKENLTAYFAQLDVEPCEAFRAYSLVMLNALRLTSEGSWLWLIEKDF